LAGEYPARYGTGMGRGTILLDKEQRHRYTNAHCHTVEMSNGTGLPRSIQGNSKINKGGQSLKEGRAVSTSPRGIKRSQTTKKQKLGGIKRENQGFQTPGGAELSSRGGGRKGGSMVIKCFKLYSRGSWLSVEPGPFLTRLLKKGIRRGKRIRHREAK